MEHNFKYCHISLVSGSHCFLYTLPRYLVLCLSPTVILHIYLLFFFTLAPERLGLSCRHTIYSLFLFLFQASLLLNNLFGLLTTEEYLNCKAVYLHVLTTNYVALRFYERHKFRLFRYMPCYYAIKGQQKNGYLYVLYINGGKPPWTFSYPLT